MQLKLKWLGRFGKSEAWVSKLLRWRRLDYVDESPFGPTTKAERLEHAKDRASSGASKPRNARKASTERQTDADDPKASADKRRALYAEEDADPETATSMTIARSTDACFTELRGDKPRRSCRQSHRAIDQWWPLMDDGGKDRVTDYFVALDQAVIDELEKKEECGGIDE